MSQLRVGIGRGATTSEVQVLSTHDGDIALEGTVGLVGPAAVEVAAAVADLSVGVLLRAGCGRQVARQRHRDRAVDAEVGLRRLSAEAELRIGARSRGAAGKRQPVSRHIGGAAAAPDGDAGELAAVADGDRPAAVAVRVGVRHAVNDVREVDEPESQHRCGRRIDSRGPRQPGNAVPTRNDGHSSANGAGVVVLDRGVEPHVSVREDGEVAGAGVVHGRVHENVTGFAVVDGTPVVQPRRGLHHDGRRGQIGGDGRGGDQ